MQKTVSIYHVTASIAVMPQSGKGFTQPITFNGKSERDFDRELKKHVKESTGLVNAMRITPVDTAVTTFKIDANKLLDFLNKYGKVVTSGQDTGITDDDRDTTDTNGETQSE